MMTAALLLLSTAVGHAEPIDRMRLVVENQILLDSDLYMDAFLQRLDSPALPFWRDTSKRPLDRLGTAAVVLHLAKGLSLYSPTERDLSDRYHTLIYSHFASTAQWDRHLKQVGLSKTSVRAALKRRLIVERYLQRAIRTSPENGDQWLAEARELVTAEQVKLHYRIVPESP